MAELTTGNELLAKLEQSQLLEPKVLKRLVKHVAQLGEQAQAPTSLAAMLVRINAITNWQARRLLAGKTQGFYIAKYKLLELLGVGGMGRVYLAEQITMQRLVAIKVVRGGEGQKRMARFAREARAVAALRHPNIIQAYDFDEQNGRPFIVMEYVEGIDSAKQVDTYGPLPWHQAADYIRQSASGLHHAHQAGLVHRDIKPGNLLVGIDGQIKLLDMGLVTFLEEESDHSLTMDEAQLGTVDYIAPEQAVDSHLVDARADIYSLGATFYSLMSGKVLFPKKTVAQKLLAHQTTQPEPLRNVVPDAPADLTPVVERMLAKDPEHRYQTAAEVEQALERFARPKSPPYELDAVRYTRSRVEPYMGRSPEPSSLALGAGDSNSSDNGSLVPTAFGESEERDGEAPSEVEAVSVDTDEGDGQTIDQISITMDEPVGRRSGKSAAPRASRAKKKGPSQVLMVATVSIVGLAVVLGAMAFLKTGRGGMATSSAHTLNRQATAEATKSWSRSSAKNTYSAATQNTTTSHTGLRAANPEKSATNPVTGVFRSAAAG